MRRKLRTPERFAALYGSAPLVAYRPKPTQTVVKRRGLVRLVRYDFAAHVTQSAGDDPRTGLPWTPHYWGKTKRWAVQSYRQHAWRDDTNSCHYSLEVARFADALARIPESERKGGRVNLCPKCLARPMPDKRTTNKSVCHCCDKQRERANNPRRAKWNRRRDTAREKGLTFLEQWGANA